LSQPSPTPCPTSFSCSGFLRSTVRRLGAAKAGPARPHLERPWAGRNLPRGPMVQRTRKKEIKRRRRRVVNPKVPACRLLGAIRVCRCRYGQGSPAGACHFYRRLPPSLLSTMFDGPLAARGTRASVAGRFLPSGLRPPVEMTGGDASGLQSK